MAQTTIYDLVRRLGLTPRPGQQEGESGNYKCPLCGGKYKLNVNYEKNTYRCVRCGAAGGMLDLFARIVFGHQYDRNDPDAKDIRDAVFGEDNAQPRQSRPVPPAITPAADDVLNKVYRALLSLPELNLTEAHKKALIARGLTEAQIGCYRSMPVPEAVDIPRIYYDLANDATKGEGMRGFKCPRIALGLYLTELLKERGITNFQGVPGWFKLEDRWCLYNIDGIMIPTRSLDGNVVSIQVRTDNAKLRYMTLSRKEFPSAVSTGISRAHVTRNTTKAPNECKVLLTEGPLKANVISALIHEPVYVIAIQGVNNTKCLFPLLKELREKGVEVIYNALDMDRITNRNVREGSKAIRRMMANEGFKFPCIVWDRDACTNIAKSFKAKLPEGRVNPQEYQDLWTYTTALAAELEEQEISHNTSWPSRSKGLDDWLKTQRSKGR